MKHNIYYETLYITKKINIQLRPIKYCYSSNNSGI